jgi:hypothetical protein
MNRHSTKYPPTTEYKPSFATYEIRHTKYEQFMQNKPNSLDTQMNVNKVLTKDYENETTLRPRQNKAKQTQFKLEAQRRSLRVSFLGIFKPGTNQTQPVVSLPALSEFILSFVEVVEPSNLSQPPNLPNSLETDRPRSKANFLATAGSLVWESQPVPALHRDESRQIPPLASLGGTTVF